MRRIKVTAAVSGIKERGCAIVGGRLRGELIAARNVSRYCVAELETMPYLARVYSLRFRFANAPDWNHSVLTCFSAKHSDDERNNSIPLVNTRPPSTNRMEKKSRRKMSNRIP